MEDGILRDSVIEVMGAIKNDERIVKAGRLLWTGIGLYSVYRIIKHTHQLGQMETIKDLAVVLRESVEESGE